MMEEKPTPSKNNDCYFYYYSSCSKGDACPYRHEPAALRNETVCIFWLQGSCNKSNCIFRHMELTKQRDRIACWFETQPGGCKKPHCPFQHQNILDHPREEDIKKKPDLILPVKKDEGGTREDALSIGIEDADRHDRQPVPPRTDSGTSTPPRQGGLQSAVPRNPIIVPLQDGESDSESISGTPHKQRARDTQLSAQLEWELRRLRQIQADEAGIIGYVIADDESGAEDGELVEDDDDDEEEEEEDMVQSPLVEEEYVVEEILEVEDTDAAHRRFHPQPRDGVLSVQMKPSKHLGLNNARKSIGRLQGGEVAREITNRKKMQFSERLGGVASRAFAETLGTDVRLRKSAIHRASKKEEESTADGRGMTDRLGLSPGKKLTLAERLGARKRELASQPRSLSDEESNSVDGSIGGPVKKLSIADRLGGRKIDLVKCTGSSEKESKSVDSSIVSRLASIRHQESEKNEPTSVDKSAAKNASSKQEERSLNFTIKSLADIKAEKQRKGGPKVPYRKVTLKEVSHTNDAKNGTKLHVNTIKKIESPKKEEQLKILSLAELKAKQNQQGKISINSVEPKTKKRSISPISFPKERPGKISSSSSSSSSSVSSSSFDKINIVNRNKCTQRESSKSESMSETENQRVSTSGVRKISIKRSPSRSNFDSEPPTKSQRLENSNRETPLGTRNITSKESNSILYNKNNNNVINDNGSDPKQSSESQKANTDNVSQKPSKISNEVTKEIKRHDSFIDDEEELLLHGDMLELEDDIDEAALLL